MFLFIDNTRSDNCCVYYYWFVSYTLLNHSRHRIHTVDGNKLRRKRKRLVDSDVASNLKAVWHGPVK